jgi:RNA polymerase sigma-70 factor (ECF subfamily)
VAGPPGQVIERLYREQASKLRRFFARRGPRDENEDLANESFVRLLAAPAIQEDRVENPEAYLQEVAKNVLRNRARAAFHRSIVDLDLDPETTTDGTDPIAMLEARDMLTRTEVSLAKLPAKTRAIFMAHRLEGATYADLAKVHGLSVKGVDWHMTKAMAHLHRFVGKR